MKEKLNQIYVKKLLAAALYEAEENSLNEEASVLSNIIKRNIRPPKSNPLKKVEKRHSEVEALIAKDKASLDSIIDTKFIGTSKKTEQSKVKKIVTKPEKKIKCLTKLNFCAIITAKEREVFGK